MAAMLGAAVLAFSVGSCATTQTPAELAQGISELRLEAVRARDRCYSPYDLVQLVVHGKVAGRGWIHTPVSADSSWNTISRPGDLDPRALLVRASFGQLDQALVFTPGADALATMGSDLVVEVWLAHRPGVYARLAIAPRYECPQFLNLSGKNGYMGFDGIPGGRGEAGPQVNVSIGYVNGPGDRPLVLVRVDERGVMRARTLFAPSAPPLVLYLDGGAGGGSAPRERKHLPVPMGRGVGIVSYDGPDSLPGNGGDGGSAAIAFDSASPDLEHRVFVHNRGGAGGLSAWHQQRMTPGRPGPFPTTTPVRAAVLFRDELARGYRVRVSSP